MLSLLAADHDEPQTYKIAQETHLYDHIINPRFRPIRGGNTFYYATSVPRLLRIGDEINFIAFSHHVPNAPAVFFFDLNQGKEVIKVNNAEIFLTFFGPASESSSEH